RFSECVSLFHCAAALRHLHSFPTRRSSDLTCCAGPGAYAFPAAASSENDQGSMNFASNTAPVPSTMPSSVAAIQRITGCWTQLWTSLMTCPVARSYQSRFERLGRQPQLDEQVA